MEKVVLYTTMGNYTQTISYYDKALSIDPNYKDALYNRQNALSRLSRYSPLSNIGCILTSTDDI